MELSAAEQAVLRRYHEKTRIAGGPRTGFVLRQEAIRWHEAEAGAGDLGAGLDALVEKGLLASSEDQRFYFLTESGVELLSGWS